MAKRIIKCDKRFTLKFNEGINGADFYRFGYGIEEEIDDTKETYEHAFARIENEVRKRCLKEREEAKNL